MTQPLDFQLELESSLEPVNCIWDLLSPHLFQSLKKRGKFKIEAQIPSVRPSLFATVLALQFRHCV